MKVTDKSFQKEVLEADRPVLVMFWGSWCPVCKRMEPMLQEMKPEFEERGINVQTINIDQNPKKSAQYKISGTPTFYLFKDGEPVDMAVGAQTKGQLWGFVQRNMG